jgi:hypothetical protein
MTSEGLSGSSDFWEMKARGVDAYAVGSTGACCASTTEDAFTHA